MLIVWQNYAETRFISFNVIRYSNWWKITTTSFMKGPPKQLTADEIRLRRKIRALAHLPSYSHPFSNLVHGCRRLGSSLGREEAIGIVHEIPLALFPRRWPDGELVWLLKNRKRRLAHDHLGSQLQADSASCFFWLIFQSCSWTCVLDSSWIMKMCAHTCAMIRLPARSLDSLLETAVMPR